MNDKQQKTNKKPKTTTNSQTVNTKPEKTKINATETI
jgi:hypothetical protein